MHNKKAIVVVMSSLKGGSGKSTLGYGFASYLANNGNKCLIIDTDYQMNMSSNFDKDISSNRMKECSLMRAFKHDAKDPQKSFNIKPANVGFNVDLISSDHHLDDIDQIMSKRPDLKNFVLLHLIFSLKLKDKYDWIIIDTHNNFQTLTKNAFIISDAILSPVTESRYSIQSIRDIIDRLSSIKKNFYNVKTGKSDIDARLFFVGNMISLSSTLSRQFASIVKNNSHFIAGFHRRSLFQKATATFNSIYSYVDGEKNGYGDRKILRNEITPEFHKIETTIKKDMEE